MKLFFHRKWHWEDMFHLGLTLAETRLENTPIGEVLSAPRALC